VPEKKRMTALLFGILMRSIQQIT